MSFPFYIESRTDAFRFWCWRMIGYVMRACIAAAIGYGLFYSPSYDASFYDRYWPGTDRVMEK